VQQSAEAAETTAGSAESPVSEDRREKAPEQAEPAGIPEPSVSGDAAASGVAADSTDSAPTATDETAGEEAASDAASEPAATAEEETPAEKPTKKGRYSKLCGG